jgi:hypothetical protein
MDLGEVFDKARKLASDRDIRQVVLVRPDLSLLILACPAAGSMPRQVIDQMEAIVSSATPRHIAVIAPTSFAPSGGRAEVGSSDWTAVGKAIPFFGLLNGLAYIGHSLWIFNGSPAEIEAGCREADLLIVDSEAAGSFSPSSIEVACKAMRRAEILIHDRATFQLRPIAPRADSTLSWSHVLESARRAALKGERSRLILVQPDKSLLPLPCIPLKAMSADHLAQARRIVPEGTARNIAVIASTELALDAADTSAPLSVRQLRAAGKAIPFFGLLLNLASAGNPVWIFDGRPESIEAGCREADLLFIDSALAGQITTGALNEAAKAMRSENIAVYDRNSREFGFLRQVAKTADQIEYRD